MKTPPGRLIENPLIGLRPYFNPLKLRLLCSRSAIRLVPVTEILKQAPLRPRHAPVSQLVQRTGKKSVRKDDAMMRVSLIGGQIDRLIIPGHQFRVVTEQKQAIEQSDQRQVIRFSHADTPASDCRSATSCCRWYD